MVTPLVKRGVPNGIPMLDAKRTMLSPGLFSRPVSRPTSTGSAYSSSQSSQGKNSSGGRKKKMKKYTVLIRKPNNKKHKTWDRDGTLHVAQESGAYSVLRDEDGVELARQVLDPSKIKPELEFRMGDLDVCINDDDLEVEGQVISLHAPSSSSDTSAIFSSSTRTIARPVPSPVTSNMSRPAIHRSLDAHSVHLGIDNDIEIIQGVAVLSSPPVTTVKPKIERKHTNVSQSKIQAPSSEIEIEVCKSSVSVKYDVLYRKPSKKANDIYPFDGTLTHKNNVATLKSEKGKVLGWIEIPSLKKDDKLFIAGKEVLVCEVTDTSEVQVPKTIKPQPTILSTHTIKKPRYNPASEDAIILPRPKEEEDFEEYVDVVIDPHLGRQLRPHQIDGVRFLYECTMGMRSKFKGALLADDMGLGKTLMTITLIWTLLNQNPKLGAKPVIKRAIIVCPLTLINNWAAEFNRWLDNRIKVFVMDKNTDVGIFNYSRCNVMLINYDRLRILSDTLRKCQFDLIVFDEAQINKSLDTRLAQAIVNLGIDRKIMLSGTPVQNNLSEFYAMAEVLNPGCLGTASAFKKQFDDPITKGRDATATSKRRQIAEERITELSEHVSGFVLRRTNELVADALPPRTDSILYCTPTAEQAAAYRELCKTSAVWQELDEFNSEEVEVGDRPGMSNGGLATMMKLKKVCNAPVLLEGSANTGLDLAKVTTAFDSGKMIVLKHMLLAIRRATSEKVVIVSQYTSTLDLIEQLLGRLGNMNSVRLDGSTPSAARQPLVDRFNKTSCKDMFAFLTSTRSGGAGINLIGGSRLFLFDCDWNPSCDNQAMARIYRMGQKRPVYIYRLLTAGCIDECIFQRQVTKQSLANQFLDLGGSAEGSSNSFTKAELRDIFTFHDNTLSHTHDLLGCRCLEHDDVVGSSGGSLMCAGSDTSTDESGEEMGGFTTARSVASDGIFVPKRMRPKNKMKGLLDYRHYSESTINADDLGDDILRTAVGTGAPVSFIMTKRNRSFE